MYQGSSGYNADIIMCIDSTGSMKPCLDNVKRQALTFYSDFINAMEEAGRKVDKLRIKVIDFRDYGDDHAPAMTESRFFNFGYDEDDSVAFSEHINSIQPLYGGDIPENALEAIALALKSDWTKEGKKRRHIIVVFTDAPALPLGARAACDGYPDGMPKDLEQLTAWWEGEDQDFSSNYEINAGRLVIFAPDAEPWTEFQTWNRTCCAVTKPGDGMNEIDLNMIVDMLYKCCWNY